MYGPIVGNLDDGDDELTTRESDIVLTISTIQQFIIGDNRASNGT